MTLILVPGHLCDARLYAPQLERFPEATVAEVTQDDSIAGMADRLLARAPERFAIAGLSMGGMVAMQVMATAPERVTGACLIATDPTPARNKEKAWRAEQQAAVRAQGLGTFIDTFSNAFFAHDPEVAARLGAPVRAMMADTPEAIYRRQSTALDTRPDLRPAMAACPVPTQIVVGSEDRICPPKLHHALADTMPDATLTVIEGCGHLASLERADIVSAAIARIA
ncbi:alpha/beta fold hydrolase [Pontivivens ytuae]|uniref:Alpha/beta fold hydrolase n=1 Tax=Pontivivens ytuae TaxID=2789856 RepID=A0A7S9QES3_9RHOB|nr:alpha/beta fold hydrolase [Pontivivens ytuae]QPH55506.1 alpha/beta fold hydrolase [Pontivivens ytuae]